MIDSVLPAWSAVPSVAQILEDAAMMRQAPTWHLKAYRDRELSQVHLQEWENACARMRRLRDRLFLYREFYALLRIGDPVAVEFSLRYLTADPWHIDSGYQKQAIWRLLGGRCVLTAVQLSRLEQAALMYLDRLLQREFWEMAKVMSRRATPQFWSEVGKAAHFLPSERQQRAGWLLLFREDLQAGMRQRVLLHRHWRDARTRTQDGRKR